ncbi:MULTISPECIES: TorD/DmsD family molecular chaperone [Photorhabdus]|uniref:Nitrate reductase n=2 Tax=Photorhabdus TaxID=29487 RepID=A0ABX0AV60_9GAMM|nr:MULTISPECIES: molecular chaperone [Photorhabdus]MCC8374911.1 molecular chaperone [Photorhabdus bodei]MCC8464687.1 molecular chaperone [Photorhabdus bodei]MCT8350337.1 molecular chaperone [Photorhabdus kayaii]MDB6367832.1 molecular chaperone [Photorhabdus bodei]MDB6372495.1 molecular chaperone [Photorhabdus bodei]
MLLDTAVPRIIGACFYYSPKSEQVRPLIPLLIDIDKLFPWSNNRTIENLTKKLATFSVESLQYDYSILFEGQGVMPAPPWGSVYLDRENALSGESTLAYREFLTKQNIVMSSKQREPEDQFGLMLLALVYILEQGHKPAARTLLEQHLLPWAYRYLELMQTTKLENDFYPILATIAIDYLKTLQTELKLIPARLELFC